MTKNDNNGEYDVLYGFRERGFGKFNAASGQLTYELGNDFEQQVI